MFTIRREKKNPILVPTREHPWEALAAYNPSVVQRPEGTYLFYRALGYPDVMQGPADGISTIGMAFAEDGVHFHSHKQVLAPQETWDRFGCEDPRVTYFEGKWYCFYTALGGFPFGPDNIKVAVAIGTEPGVFTERHLITPFNAKAATLLPERVNDQVVLLLTAHTDYTPDHPRPTTAIARAKELSEFFNPSYWERWHEELLSHGIQELRRTDDDHVEVGATPLKTKHGWLLIYSYIQKYYDERQRIFSVEAALLDSNDPQKLISRGYPMMVPEEFYELYGLVPRIVFPTSITLTEDNQLEIWYGGADTVCAKARVYFPDLMQALTEQKPRETFIRAEENPILEPKGDGFEARDVFNPAAVDIKGTVHILYRAMDNKNTSTIGLALAHDGVHIHERLETPIYTPRADFEQKKGDPNGNSGCEDPRAVEIDGEIYLTYTAYDGVHAPKGAVSHISKEDFWARRFDAWSEPKLLTPDDVDDKDLALLPAKVDGNFLLYHRISNQICADLIPDLDGGKRVSRCIEILAPRRGMWDSEKVGMAAPPIRVGDDWLLIYHGVSARSIYRLGAALLDSSGLVVKARSADPVLEPLEKYEKEGDVPNVVFGCGAVVRDDTIYLYYGGADHVVGVATTSLSDMLASLTR